MEKNTLVSLAEHLVKDTGNTCEHHHQSWTTRTPQAMKCPWTISVLWQGRTIVLPETLKKQFTSEQMTHPSTGTLASSSCHTSGMRCWQDHQNYIFNNANNIRHGGTPKPTNNHRFITSEPT